MSTLPEDDNKKIKEAIEYMKKIIMSPDGKDVVSLDPDDESVAYVMDTGIDISASNDFGWSINKFPLSDNFIMCVSDSKNRAVTLTVTLSQAEKLRDYLTSQLRRHKKPNQKIKS